MRENWFEVEKYQSEPSEIWWGKIPQFQSFPVQVFRYILSREFMQAWIQQLFHIWTNQSWNKAKSRIMRWGKDKVFYVSDRIQIIPQPLHETQRSGMINIQVPLCCLRRLLSFQF